MPIQRILSGNLQALTSASRKLPLCELLIPSKIVKLCFGHTDNKLMELPNEKIGVLASLLFLDVSNNLIEELPSNLPYLYRLETLLAKYVQNFFNVCPFL